jgi:hypothetical protein
MALFFCQVSFKKNFYFNGSTIYMNLIYNNAAAFLEKIFYLLAGIYLQMEN